MPGLFFIGGSMSKREKFVNYSNSALRIAINEWIKKDLHRQIFEYWLVDGMTYEQIAEKVDRSDKQVQRIIYKYELWLLSHL